MITTEPIKKCIKCLETLPLSGFHSKGFRNGKKRYDPQCKKCRNKIALDIYQKNIIDYFGGLKCNRCGFTGKFAQFDVHHLDPSTKSKSISRLRSSTNLLIKELNKGTEMLCANCHRLIDHK